MPAGWRVSLRIARRDLWRAKGRNAVAFVMVMLPVLAVVALDVSARTVDVSPAESFARTMGAADALAEWSGINGRVAQSPDGTQQAQKCTSCHEQPEVDPRTEAAMLQVMSGGSRLVPYREDFVVVRTPAGVSRPQAVELDIADPAARGIFEIVEGRAAESDGELAVSQRLESRGFPVGSRITLDTGREFSVVGIVRAPLNHDLNAVVGRPGALNASRRSAWLIDSPNGVSWRQVQRLNELGVYVTSRAVVLDPPPRSEWPPELVPAEDDDAAVVAVLALVGVMALLEVVLLAGPAFAVGARKQRRALALVAATGGEPRHVRRIVLASGLVVGLCASALGALAGIALAWLARPLIQRLLDQALGPFEVPLVDVVLIAAIGTASALLAALVPAWSAARQDVVQVLGGRRGQPPISWRWSFAGALLMAVGILVAVAGARQSSGGEIAIALSAPPTILGAVLLTPWFVGLLGSLGRFMPLPLRFAVRDGARQRGRTAPAVAAVMATVAGVVALAIGAASDAEQTRAEWTPLALRGTGVLRTVDLDAAIWANLEETLRNQLPRAEVVAVRGVPHGLPAADGWFSETVACAEGAGPGSQGCPLLRSAGDSLGTQILVGEESLDLLDIPQRADQLPAARAALRAGGVVVFSEQPLTSDRIDVLQIAVSPEGEASKQNAERTTIRAARLAYGGMYGPATMVVSERAAAQLGFAVVTTALAVRGTDISAGEEDAVSEAARAVTENAWFAVERGYTDDGTRIALLLLGVFGAVLVLGATVTATALALSDARPDLATLAAVGASPRVRRGIAASYAASIGLLGALVGAAVGFVPGLAVAFPLTSSSWSPEEVVDTTGRELPSVFIEIPWLLIGWIVVAVPLIAAVSVALTTRARLPMVRRVP